MITTNQLDSWFLTDPDPDPDHNPNFNLWEVETLSQNVNSLYFETWKTHQQLGTYSSIVSKGEQQLTNAG